MVSLVHAAAAAAAQLSREGVGKTGVILISRSPDAAIHSKMLHFAVAAQSETKFWKPIDRGFRSCG
jgi:hypothetical protein